MQFGRLGNRKRASCKLIICTLAKCCNLMMCTHIYTYICIYRIVILYSYICNTAACSQYLDISDISVTRSDRVEGLFWEKGVCQSVPHAYKVANVFIKDCANKILLRAGSRDNADEVGVARSRNPRNNTAWRCHLCQVSLSRRVSVKAAGAVALPDFSYAAEEAPPQSQVDAANASRQRGFLARHCVHWKVCHLPRVHCRCCRYSAHKRLWRNTGTFLSHPISPWKKNVQSTLFWVFVFFLKPCEFAQTLLLSHHRLVIGS